MSKYVCGTGSDKLYEALLKHGVVNEPANEVARVVIDSAADVLLDAGIADLEEA